MSSSGRANRITFVSQQLDSIMARIFSNAISSSICENSLISSTFSVIVSGLQHQCFSAAISDRNIPRDFKRHPARTAAAAAQAIAEFKRILSGLGGGGAEDSLAARLGLGEMSTLFDNPPPGADELVALSKVLPPIP